MARAIRRKNRALGELIVVKCPRCGIKFNVDSGCAFAACGRCGAIMYERAKRGSRNG